VKPGSPGGEAKRKVGAAETRRFQRLRGDIYGIRAWGVNPARRFLSLFLLPDEKRHLIRSLRRHIPCPKTLGVRLEASSRSVWEGKLGETYLRVAVHASGRIEANWRAKAGNDRRVVVNTIDELERSVLFQLMLTAPPDQQGVSGDIAHAVAQAKVGLPDPENAPRPPRKKKGGQQRRRRRHGK
jgi:hypothetical protein